MFNKILSAFLIAAPLMAVSEPVSTVVKQKHTTIKANQLKSWYDQDKEMIVLDARSKGYFDGRLLPNAIWMPAESSEEEILDTIPDKDSLIIVYCASVKCPASGWLYDKLDSMGYNHIYEYHEGIADWVKRGFPITE